MVKLLLSNNNRSPLSHELVGELAVRYDVDILVTTETNGHTVVRNNWCVDSAGVVAIYDVSGHFGRQLYRRDDGIWAIELVEIMIIGAYVTPNCDLMDYADFVDCMVGVINSTTKKIILIDDFNCKSVESGSPYTNRRGDILTDMTQSLGFA